MGRGKLEAARGEGYGWKGKGQEKGGISKPCKNRPDAIVLHRVAFSEVVGVYSSNTIHWGWAHSSVFDNANKIRLGNTQL